MSLPASRCPTCGLVCSPPEPFGCEQCGTPAAEAVTLDISSAGTVASFATVHRHHRPEPATPFTIVSVRLDAGPALKGLFCGEGAAAIGDRVVGEVIDDLIRFVPSG